MKLLKNHTYIQGFEDYNIVSIGDSCFTSNWGFWIPYYFDTRTETHLICKNLPVKVYNREDPVHNWIKFVEFEPELVVDHKELLNTAKKVFAHPSCKLSRSMMAEKYKKSLNPFFSDAIVIPKPDYTEFYLQHDALFINEKAKLIVRVFNITDKDAIKIVQGLKEGDKFKDVISCPPDDSYGRQKPYTTEDLLDAEFFYYGDVLSIPNSQSWVADLLTNNLPADKIVFEESVQESLSSETNQLDFDSLCSIKDMLESSDENTVSAGLKSLSMMDWMHYPQSIKFILNNTNNKYNWLYNKACNSTSVKYMMKTIAGNRARKRNWWPGDFDDEIYEADFELFKKLKCHYHHIQPEQIMSYIRSFSFMMVNTEGFVYPNIKQRD